MASGHMNDNLNSAQTGDTTPLVLLAVISVTAAVLWPAVVLVGRKQKQNKRYHIVCYIP